MSIRPHAVCRQQSQRQRLPRRCWSSERIELSPKLACVRLVDDELALREFDLTNRNDAVGAVEEKIDLCAVATLLRCLRPPCRFLGCDTRDTERMLQLLDVTKTNVLERESRPSAKTRRRRQGRP